MEDDKIDLQWAKFLGQLILCFVALMSAIFANQYIFGSLEARHAIADTAFGPLIGALMVMGTFVIALWVLRVPYRSRRCISPPPQGAAFQARLIARQPKRMPMLIPNDTSSKSSRRYFEVCFQRRSFWNRHLLQPLWRYRQRKIRPAVCDIHRRIIRY